MQQGSIANPTEANANYYKLPRAVSNFANVTVRLTMTNNGNVDLFCSVQLPTSPATRTYEWSSTAEGRTRTTSVYFDWTDPLLQGIRMAERYFYCAVHATRGQPHAAVHVHACCTRTTTPVATTTRSSQLEEGMPQNYDLRADTYMYFRYTPVA